MDEKRRSTRVTGILPIILTGIDSEGQRFREVTWTISLNMHGAKATTVKKLGKDDRVMIQCYPTESPTESRVAWSDSMGKGFVFGFEMTEPKNLWGLTNPPNDWKGLSLQDRARPAIGSSEGAQPAAPAAPKDQTNASPIPSSQTAESSSARTFASAGRADPAGEIGQLLEKIRQAHGATRESLKVYQELESQSAHLVAEACDRIHQRVSAELEGSFAAAAQALSARASETLGKTEEGLERMRHSHEGRVEEIVRSFEKRLQDTVQASLEESQKRIVESVRDSIEQAKKDISESQSRLDEHARAAAEAIRSQSEDAAQAMRESVERTKMEIDGLFGRSRDKWRQELQEEMASVLGACRQGSNNLMQDFCDRLVEAAHVLSGNKAQTPASAPKVNEGLSTLPS
jgi:hypothetical protein